MALPVTRHRFIRVRTGAISAEVHLPADLQIVSPARFPHRQLLRDQAAAAVAARAAEAVVGEAAAGNPFSAERRDLQLVAGFRWMHAMRRQLMRAARQRLYSQ